MDITIHSEDPRTAKIRYLDYKKQVAIHREKRQRHLQEVATRSRKELYWARKKKDRLHTEDEELMAMYKAMREGKRVIILGEVFSETGVDEDGLPNLAIGRADWKWCHFGVSGGRTSYGKDTGPFFSEYGSYWDHTRHNSIYMPDQYFPTDTTNTHWRSQHNKPSYPVKSMVPTVPAHLRPDDLSKYWILWEAEWDKSPPEDPILLSRLNLYTFAVVAEWDLSPLERSVLYGRPS